VVIFYTELGRDAVRIVAISQTAQSKIPPLRFHHTDRQQQQQHHQGAACITGRLFQMLLQLLRWG